MVALRSLVTELGQQLLAAAPVTTVDEEGRAARCELARDGTAETVGRSGDKDPVVRCSRGSAELTAQLMPGPERGAPRGSRGPAASG
jgi:hypothetical protein